MVVTVTHAGYIKRVPLVDLPGAAPRRQGPRRHGDARGGFRHPPVRRQHPHAGAVLLLARPGLQGEGVAAAARGAAGARQGADQPAAARAGERITTIMPLPEDEASWDKLDVMFATTGGTVRRNKLSDFVDVRRSGKIAMKLDEGEAIVGVQICTERDDVLLTTGDGQCIRFPVPEVRVFRAATRSACAASPWRAATSSSRWRSCAMSTRPAKSVPPISRAPARCGEAAARRPRTPSMPSPIGRGAKAPSSSARSAMRRCRPPSSSS